MSEFENKEISMDELKVQAEELGIEFAGNISKAKLIEKIQAFANKANKYAQDDYWRDDEEYLVNKYFNKPNAKILVLGCGGGRTLMPLYKKNLKITAIDIVPEMVEAAKKRVVDLAIEVKLMDATKLQFSNDDFDYVFFPFHGIDNVQPNIEACFKEVARVLKKDGVFIYNSHNRWFWKKLKYIFSKYAYYDEYKQYRSSIFDVFKLKKFFGIAQFKFRIMMQKKEASNWKDKCYKIFPFVSSSIYFISKNVKK